MARVSSRDPALIPGVRGREAVPPKPVFNANVQIEAARKRAAIRDAIDIAVLVAVDIFYLSWPAARIPFLSRDTTMWVLVALHALVVLSWFRSRLYTKWRASRISSTWSDGERRQFKNRGR
jgi:hypothetical protein